MFLPVYSPSRKMSGEHNPVLRPPAGWSGSKVTGTGVRSCWGKRVGALACFQAERDSEQRRKPPSEEIKGGERKEVGLQICPPESHKLSHQPQGAKKNAPMAAFVVCSPRGFWPQESPDQDACLASMVCTHGRMWVSRADSRSRPPSI